MRQIGLAVPIGQKSVMTDSDEPFGQAVEQEPADKFNRGNRDGYGFVLLSVFGVKNYPVVIMGNNATVGNRCPMGIAGQVLEHLFGFLNRFAYTDDPLVGIEFVFKRWIWLAKTDFVATDGTGQKVNELAAKDQ